MRTLLGTSYKQRLYLGVSIWKGEGGMCGMRSETQAGVRENLLWTRENVPGVTVDTDHPRFFTEKKGSTASSVSMAPYPVVL